MSHRRKDVVLKRARSGQHVSCRHVSAEDGVLVALLIIDFADKLLLIYFLNGVAVQSEDVLSRAERINELLNIDSIA